MLVTVLYVVLTRRIHAPTVIADEVGMLGNARWMSGGKLWPMESAAFYDIGYPMILTPLFILIEDPGLLYRGVLMLNAVMMGVFVLVAYRLARSVVGVRPREARVAALCGALYPAIWVHVGVAWAETAAVLCFAIWLLTAVRLSQRFTLGASAMHAVAAGLASAIHGRFVMLPWLFVAACIVVAVRQPHRRIAATGGALIAVAAVRLTSYLSDAVFADRWLSTERRAAKPGDVVDTLPWGFVRTLGGQSWYLLAATLGMAVIGLVILMDGARASNDLRSHEQADAASDMEAPLGRMERCIRFGMRPGVYIAVGSLSVILVSAAFMSAAVARTDLGQRVDYTFYGRYNEALAPTFVAIGVAGIIGGGRPRVYARLLRLAAILGALCLVVAVLLQGSVDYTGPISPYTVATLEPFFLVGDDAQTSTRFFMLPVALVAILLTLGASVLATRARYGAAVIVALASLVGGVLVTQRIEPSIDHANAIVPTWERLRAQTPDVVAYDVENFRIYGFFVAPWYLDDSRIVRFRSSDEVWPVADLYIGPLDWPQAQGSALIEIGRDERLSQSFWISQERVGP